MKILQIDSSPLGDASVSRQLTRATVEAWQARYPQAEVVHRDLVADAPEHLTAERLAVIKFGKDAELTPAQAEERALIDGIVGEFLSADVVVIGAPMYNFTVPTQLKAWIDRLLQAGRTFRYTETGPVGLAGGRRVIVVSSRGGIYTAGLEAMDHQEAYLRTALGFIGVTEIEFVRAEGLGYGPEHRDRAVAEAHQQAKASPGLAAAA
ncbi:FMN-dependent NADH-azoreductase [Inquilinus limosus]|uniref:FMN dependent NADH:quinone oxidoreductase n=1 Tax=Inquilinus limosus MP06 TaxID=1398085 RepID=A0A0A0D0C7_9PROT|nr:FMN-dependent NADH-azoreductase [Inquilinus limosus]KGM31288.1 FMN-dependent NADH-azoreductase [Inquilinus limosus MP06]